MKFSQEHIAHLNHQFKGIPPEEIISWAVERARRPVLTTNFRPYEVAILHAVAGIAPTIPVIWWRGFDRPVAVTGAESRRPANSSRMNGDHMIIASRPPK